MSTPQSSSSELRDRIRPFCWGEDKVLETNVSRVERLISQEAARQTRVAEVESLLRLRKLYDGYEARGTTDFEGNKIATWSGYKFFRNPLSDRIEEITGFRSDQDVEKWLAAIRKGQA